MRERFISEHTRIRENKTTVTSTAKYMRGNPEQAESTKSLTDLNLTPNVL